MSSTLLCTTGSSPAVVIEAYLLCEPLPDTVHCLTTDSDFTPVEILHAFFEKEGVPFTCVRISGLDDLRTGLDQVRFDEVLYRWFLRHRSENQRLLACIAGGFKTMSASLQQAAEYFGAEEVFHVLAGNIERPGGRPSPPCNEEEIRAALASSNVHRIDLAPSKGWTPLRRIQPDHFPLDLAPTRSGESKAEASGKSLCEEVRRETGRAFSAENTQESVPFSSLSLLAGHERAWLGGALDVYEDEAWVRALPKVELHCHLGGFATHGELLEKVRDAAANPGELSPLKQDCAFPDPWPIAAQCIDLKHYMKLGDNNGSALLKDPGCLKKQCELLYGALVADNVVYAEVRCSPHNYATPERSAWDVLTDIRSVFDDCMGGSGPTCHVNLIIIATRKDGGDLSSINRHLALAVTAADTARDIEGRCQVAGVDLAGFENQSTRPAYFSSDFRGVHRCGLSTTVHAGENDDVESMWQAVYDLKADRIGHGLRLAESPDLLRVMARRRLAIELCPFANVQIVGFAPYTDLARVYPLRTYLDEGLRVTINTDNIGMSNANLSDNILLAARLCPEEKPLLRSEILTLQKNAIEAAFISPGARETLIRRMDQDLLHMNTAKTFSRETRSSAI